MNKSIVRGYKTFVTAEEIHLSAGKTSEVGDVGTSISVSVTYSASISWTFTVSF